MSKAQIGDIDEKHQHDDDRVDYVRQVVQTNLPKCGVTSYLYEKGLIEVCAQNKTTETAEAYVVVLPGENISRNWFHDSFEDMEDFKSHLSPICFSVFKDMNAHVMTYKSSPAKQLESCALLLQDKKQPPLTTFKFSDEDIETILTIPIAYVLAIYYNKLHIQKIDHINRLHATKIVIISALPEEHSAIHMALLNRTKKKPVSSVSATNYLIHQWNVTDDKGKHLNIYQTQLGAMGAIESLSVTTGLLAEFHPRFVIMPGVCAGRQTKVQIGDVIIANRVFMLEGKVSEDHSLKFDISTADVDAYLLGFFESVNQLYQKTPTLKQELVLRALFDAGTSGLNGVSMRSVGDFSTEEEYKQLVLTDLRDTKHSIVRKDGKHFLSEEMRIFIQDKIDDGLEFPSHENTFTPHVGPVAVSNNVHEDLEVLWDRIEIAERKTLAVEMEGVGVFKAVTKYNYKNEHCSAILVKGVMDFGNGTKNDTYKKKAASNSASWVVEFIMKCTDDAADKKFNVQPSHFQVLS